MKEAEAIEAQMRAKSGSQPGYPGGGASYTAQPGYPGQGYYPPQQVPTLKLPEQIKISSCTPTCVLPEYEHLDSRINSQSNRGIYSGQPEKLFPPSCRNSSLFFWDFCY